MKVKILTAFLLFGMSTNPMILHAERRGDQGVGVMIGNPTGFSYKMWLDEQIGFDASAGINQGEFNLHATLLVHNFTTAKKWAENSSFLKSITEDGNLPWYIGAGPRVLFEHKVEYGVRLPLGIAFLPHNSQWETFFEVAPVIRLSPDAGLDGDFAFGVRYYFPAIRPRT